MASVLARMSWAYRFLIAGVIVLLGLGQPYAAQAETQYGGTGPTGPIDVIDSAGAPGVRCYYNSSGLLYRLLVIRPRMYARDGYAQQPVSFRARDQWLYADGRQDVIDSNAAIYRHSPTLQAVGDNHAPFDHLPIDFRVNPSATGTAFVDMVAEWRNPRTYEIEGAKAYYLTHYRKYQNRADGSVAFRGDVTGGCPVRVS